MMKLSPFATALLTALTGLVFLLLYGPLFIPIISSFFTITHGEVQWNDPSLSAYWALTANKGILEAVGNTLLVGFSATLLSLVAGTLLAIHYCGGKSIGPSMIEASADLGASAGQTLVHIILPNLRSALIGAAVLSFALSFDETLITLLVTGTDSTLPIRLWAMMRLGFAPDINALVAIILALTIALCLVAVRQFLPADSEQG